MSTFLTLSSLHLYLQLQLWVVSHVNQQAVEGGQALSVSLAAGTPWMEVTYNKFTFIQHKHTNRDKGRQTDARAGCQQLGTVRWCVCCLKSRFKLINEFNKTEWLEQITVQEKDKARLDPMCLLARIQFRVVKSRETLQVYAHKKNFPVPPVCFLLVFSIPF